MNKNIYKLGALVIALSLAVILIYVLATEPPSPELHLIVGEANYDGSVPADGAVISVVNERTLEELSDVVGSSGNSGTSGWFLVDISEMPSGYREGDQLRVVGRGTGGYSGWYGLNSSAVDNSTVSQIVNGAIPLPANRTRLFSRIISCFATQKRNTKKSIDDLRRRAELKLPLFDDSDRETITPPTSDGIRECKDPLGGLRQEDAA